RWYMVEYPLTALLAVSILLLIQSKGLKCRSTALWFGVACAMGMLLKVTFTVFILPVFIYIWIRLQRPLRFPVLAALPCLVLAMPWYASHLRPTIAFALKSGFGPMAAVYGTGPIFSLGTIMTYASRIVVNGTSEYYAGLTIA